MHDIKINPVVRCNQHGECFGRLPNGICDILSGLFPEDHCPFQKGDQQISDGHIKIVLSQYPKNCDWISDNSLFEKLGKARASTALREFHLAHPDECAVYKEITIVRKSKFEKFYKELSA